jgi:hypothetical protein
MTICIPGRDRSGLVTRLPSIIFPKILIALEVVTAELLAKTLLLIKGVIILLDAAS